MTNKQIRDIVSRRLKKPTLALIVFHIIASIALRYLDDIDSLPVSLILMFVALNIFFLMALMSELLVKVLTDINNEKKS